MSSRPLKSFLWHIASRIPGLIVLSVLVGLLAWGHHSHWKIPRFAALWGSEEDSHSAPSAHSEVIPFTKGDTLYRIRLASQRALKKAGIQTVPLVSRPLKQHITANGTLDYDQTVYAEVSPLATGTVWEVFKHEGDKVEKGDLLALVASPSVVKAKADLLHALLQVEAQEHTLKRMRATADVIAERKLREAERDLREARIRLFSEQQRLVNLGLPVRSKDLLGAPEDKVVERLRTAGLPQKAFRGMDLSTLPNNLLPLYAPFRGQVVKRACVVGELVTPADVQFIVADTRRLWILLDVRLEDSDLLTLGQEVTFRPDGVASALAHGRITWIRPGVDKRTRTVRVRAEVENPDDDLRPDTFGTGRILVRSSNKGMAIPTAAIQREGDASLVFVHIGEAIFEGRRIKLGARDDEYAEVQSGLRPGEAIVTAGSHVLKSEILRSRLASGD